MNPAGTAGMSTAGRNALVTSAMVCCGYIICFTPFHILVTIGYNTKAVDFGSWYYHLLTVLMFSNSIINPFIYAAKYRDFQEGIKRLMQKVKPNNQSQVTAVT